VEEHKAALAAAKEACWLEEARAKSGQVSNVLEALRSELEEKEGELHATSRWGRGNGRQR
jgi:hypothetical protein